LISKDQADIIRYEYEELLEANPDLRDELWADYEATLIKDPETGIILRAPISLQKFYTRNLKPYVDKAIELEAADTGVAPVKPVADPVQANADNGQEASRPL